MSTGRKGVFAANLSWPDLKRRLQAGAVAVLPVGSAYKQHGTLAEYTD